jgi:hypothetical protein
MKARLKQAEDITYYGCGQPWGDSLLQLDDMSSLMFK